jgi:hypothetical protein
VVVAASWFVADSSVWHATIVGLLAAKIAIITNTIIRLFITLWYSLSVSVRCTVFATTNPAKIVRRISRVGECSYKNRLPRTL